MKRLLLTGILLTTLTMVGCAGFLTTSINATTAAINDAAQLHCGVAGAPAAPFCLSDAQFQKVNADLNAASEAELAAVQVKAGVATAKTESLDQAILTIAVSLGQAYQDILAGVSSVSATAAADIQRALAGL